MAAKICINFLGNRAIHAAPSKENMKYGGNSSCLLIESEGPSFIVNAGFGVNHYGEQLVAKYLKSRDPVVCHFFLSDFLWDNIVGIPFFSPIHFKSSRISIHSGLDSKSAEERFVKVCSPDFSPFNGLSSFNSTLAFEQKAKPVDFGLWQVEQIPIIHPMANYHAAVWVFTHKSGYRIAVSGAAVFDPVSRQSLVSKLSGVELFIQSAVAPAIINPTFAGRFTFDEAVQLGIDLNAGQVILNGFHPMLSDSDLAQAEADLITKWESKGSVSKVSLAKEPKPIKLSLPVEETTNFTKKVS